MAADDSRVEAGGQRRQVTVLFADIADYTPLAERLGEERTYLLMQRVLRDLSQAVQAESGTVQDMAGDGVMALFGAPVALENAPVNACRAALAMQRRIAAIAADEAEGLRLRVGIHAGPLVVGEVGAGNQIARAAMGDTVNLAARLEAAAEPETIAISDGLYQMVDGFVSATALGERRLKGKSAPQKLWRLDAMNATATRFDIARRRGLTAMVGRDIELDRLDAVWRQAAAGAVRAVHVSGEAGIGKSRLVHELISRLDPDRVFLLEGHCRPEGQGVPFLPFIEVVRRSFRIPDGAGPEEIARRLRRGLEVLGLAPEGSLPYLMNLLGQRDDALGQVGDEAVGLRTRDAILAMLRERCRLGETILIVDNLHWIDGGSEDLLARIIALDEALPLMVLTTARPDYAPPWAGDRGADRVKLGPLSAAGTADLLRKRLGHADLPEALVRLIVEKADGNPFFAEELATYLQAQGRVQIDQAGVRFGAAADGATLPVALENLLLQRFDGLAEGPRAVLECAAAIGPSFAGALLSRACGQDSAAALQVLQAADLVEPAGGQDRWSFKHNLIRDAVYGSLLTARREALHAAVAGALEADGQGHESPELLAHHWSATSHADKAVHYLAEAGGSSLRIYALEEAEAHFRQAIALAEADPAATTEAKVADLLLRLARVLYFQCKFLDIIAIAESHLPRVEALGDKKRLARFLFEGGYASVFAARTEPGTAMLERSKALAREQDDELAVAYAELGLMWHRLFWGPPEVETRRAQNEIGERVYEIGRRHGDVWLASKALLCLGLDAVSWGRPGAGRRHLLRLIEMSRETNDPRPRGMAHWGMAALHVFSQDYEAAIESADEALHACLCEVDLLSARAYRAAALGLSGQTEEGIATLKAARAVAVAGGIAMNMAGMDISYGVAEVLAGDMAAGVRRVRTASADAEVIGQASMPRLADLYLGEVFTQLALGTAKPSAEVLRKNLWFLLTTLPVARRKARAHLERAEDFFRRADAPSYVAASQLALGRLDVAAKRPGARARLEEARDLARSVEADKIAAEAEAALAAL